MKKKAFKKTLAGVMAAAALASAMPMSLIADAYSYNNVDQTSFADLFENLKVSDSVAKSTGVAGDAFASGTFNLAAYTYKLTKYEIPGATDVSNNPNKWDTAKAAQDIIDTVKDVTAVTFKDDGTIATITMLMPETDAALVTKAENVKYVEKEFTVVRTAADLNAELGKVGTNVKVILAADISDEVDHINVQYINLDLNLNGYDLTVTNGIKVTNKTLNIWGAKKNPSGKSTLKTGDTADTAVIDTTTTASYVNIYDDVAIEFSKTTGGTAPAIKCQTGEVRLAGDNVTIESKTAGNNAILGDGFKKGDYKLTDGDTPTEIDFEDLTADAKVVSSKIHNYNKFGIEVTDRTADFNPATSTSKNYLDADLRTAAKDYAYEPAASVSDSVVDGKLADAGDTTVRVSKPGQLYWISDAVTGRGNGLTVTIMNDLDFAGMPEKFTPIDASGFKIVIAGNDSAGKVIKNIDILSSKVDAATGQENAGLISKTKEGVANEIKYIGIENAKIATTKVEDAYAGVFAGEANQLILSYVYALNPTFANAKYKGSAVAKLHNGSNVGYSYFASKFPVFNSVDNSSVNLLTNLDNNKTVYYDKTLYAASTAHEKRITAATTAEFTSGKVAFILNKHNPAQAVENTSNTNEYPKAWNNGNAAGECSVDKLGAASNASTEDDYKVDKFGQTLDGKSYPTFIKLDTTVISNINNVAVNRVFRQITQDCSGNKTSWTADNAKFGNIEIDLSSGHKDAKGDHRCDECGAYEIAYWFHADLAPYLSATNANKGDYGLADANSIDGKYIALNKIGPMTAVTFDLRKSKTTVDTIVDAVNTVKDGKCGIKGMDILNMAAPAEGSKTLSAATAGSMIANINFIVNDEVICKVYDSDDVIENVGFKVANAAVTDLYKPVADGSSTSNVTVTGVAAAPTTTIVVDKTPVKQVTKANATSKYDVYVAAAIKDKAIPYAVFASNKDAIANISIKPLNDYQFVIKFAGVKHNDVKDHKPVGGSVEWNAGAADNNVGTIVIKDITEVDGTSEWVAKNATIDSGHHADKEIHAFKGKECGCIVEEAHTNEFAITNKGHQGKCGVCDLQLGAKFTDDAATMTPSGFTPHTLETVFTTGTLTLKRCTVCSYTTFTKDTTMTAGVPAIELVESEDGVVYRQKYAFDIAAGDNTIVSYGVLYTKDGTAIDTAKLESLNDTGKYFKADGTINATVLGGVKYSSKKNIKTGGTYNVNVSMDNMTDDVQICGYVIYQDAANQLGIATTKVVTNNYETIAINEIENNCAVYYDGRTNASETKYRQKFVTDVETGFTIKTVGVIIDKAGSFGSVDVNTTIESMNAAAMTKTAVPPTRPVQTIAYMPTTTKVNVGQMARGYATIEYKGVTYTIYTDLVNANPVV